MATVSDYLTQLQSDKQTLVDNLVAKGVDATSDETFTSLVPKVASIEGGGSSKYAPRYLIFASYNGSELNEELANLDTSNMTKFDSMFSNCTSLTELDLTSFDTSKARSMNNMFYYCSRLTSLNLSQFNTSNVTSMLNMFQNCASLTQLDLSNFNTSNVTNMGSMFYSCKKLSSLDLSSFNTPNVTSMTNMFRYCKVLNHLDIRNFDFTNVTNYEYMFDNMPTDCEIIVKDDTAKTWITEKFTTLTNVKTVAEKEAEGE